MTVLIKISMLENIVHDDFIRPHLISALNRPKLGEFFADITHKHKLSEIMQFIINNHVCQLCAVQKHNKSIKL